MLEELCLKSASSRQEEIFEAIDALKHSRTKIVELGEQHAHPVELRGSSSKMLQYCLVRNGNFNDVVQLDTTHIPLNNRDVLHQRVGVCGVAELAS